MNKRKAFNFYRSFYDVYKELNEKQAKEFMDNLLAVEFLEKSIDEVVFKDKICSIIWSSIKHSIEAQVKGYAHKTGLSLENDIPTVAPTVAPCQQGEGEEEGEEKEQGEGIFNASFHFAPLSELVSQLKAKKDTQKHKPLKTIKEFDNYLKDFAYETEDEKNAVDDALDMGYMFIKYRDYMFSLTKETKYRLLTSKSVADFIDVIYSDFKDIDLVVLFDKMEAKGWASLQKGKGWKL